MSPFEKVGELTMNDFGGPRPESITGLTLV